MDGIAYLRISAVNMLGGERCQNSTKQLFGFSNVPLAIYSPLEFLARYVMAELPPF